MPKIKNEKSVEVFGQGTINVIGSELIKDGAASASRNFITYLDRIELTRGRKIIGAEESGNNPVKGLWAIEKPDGTWLLLRKIGTDLQYLDSDDVWQDIKTDFTASEELSFANSFTPAGRQVWFCCADGLFKLYPSSPTSVIDLTDDTKNPKVRSKILIEKSRMIAWGHEDDPTGLRFSKVDRDSNYTEVTDEAIGASGSKTYTGTLDHTQMFGLVITDGTQVVTDDKNGNLTGDGTGTINYATGEYSVTFNATTTDAVTASYLYENSNTNGLSDFTYSSPRAAGEGNIQRQDAIGTISKNVISFANQFFTLQDRGSYNVQIDSDDTTWNNDPFRTQIGTPTWKASIPVADGIIFVDTYDEDNPKLRMLAYDKYNELIIPYELSKDKFDMSAYEYDQCAMGKKGDLVLISCRTSNSTVNNRTIVYNMKNGTFDVLTNGYTCFIEADNKLYAGDSLSPNVYEILSGYDDDGFEIEGEWEGKNDNLNTEQLKKVKRFQIEGYISKEQATEIWASYDNDEYELLGTINGNGEYVDKGGSILVGEQLVGEQKVGDGPVLEVYHYLAEIKIMTPKFQRVKPKFVPTGLGYFDFRKYKFSDIRTKGHKLPKKYRTQAADDEEE
ncbi:MAG TPA: hypothetical protein PKZ42_01815 [Syntrophales bacterium]|nr:hypothetical protein [Syntrophales bacterium]